MKPVKKTTTIKTAMTPFPHSVDIETPVSEAHAFMKEHKIRHLPITESGELIGVVTDRDISLLLGPASDDSRSAKLEVTAAMVHETYVVDLETPLKSVARTMAERHIGSALVTRQGKLAGIFTVTDACRVLSDLLELDGDVGPDEAA
jgi:acetoin utilization protein AcuB